MKVSQAGTMRFLGLAKNPKGWGMMGEMHDGPGKNPWSREMPYKLSPGLLEAPPLSSPDWRPGSRSPMLCYKHHPAGIQSFCLSPAACVL